MSEEITDTNVVAAHPNSTSVRRIRRIAATTTALTFMLQNFAWAVCNDGTNFPPGGFTAAGAVNWSPLTFTGTLGSAWVPDVSVNEHNNPGEPRTLGGHDWVFDQGSTTCKMVDAGGASGPPLSWSIPPVNGTDCVILPILRNVANFLVVVNFGDIPQHGTTLTPTCDPTILASPSNTYFNQLGCALVRQATGRVTSTTPETAATFLFTAGIKTGLFAYPLTNFPVSIAGFEAGKISGIGFTVYEQVPQGQKLDWSVITPDGQYLLGASSRNNDSIFACRNPLGDPGDPSQRLPSFADFSVSQDTSQNNKAGVQCMMIGQGGDGRIKGLAVGADGQPYMAGTNIITNFTDFPACIAAGFGGVPAGADPIAAAFAAHTSNHCGTATPNDVLNTAPDGVTAIRVETQALVSHGNYLYRGVKGGVIYQASVDETGVTSQRFFATGLASPTGIGFSQDNGTPSASTMLYDDASALGLTAREVIYKLPVCEDFE